MFSLSAVDCRFNSQTCICSTTGVTKAVVCVIAANRKE